MNPIPAHTADLIGTGHRRCRLCMEVKTLTEFARCPHCREGRDYRCLECIRVHSKRAYDAASPEVRRRRWYLAA